MHTFPSRIEFFWVRKNCLFCLSRSQADVFVNIRSFHKSEYAHGYKEPFPNPAASEQPDKI